MYWVRCKTFLGSYLILFVCIQTTFIYLNQKRLNKIPALYKLMQCMYRVVLIVCNSIINMTLYIINNIP